jgi:hypothetical protein
MSFLHDFETACSGRKITRDLRPKFAAGATALLQNGVKPKTALSVTLDASRIGIRRTAIRLVHPKQPRERCYNAVFTKT